MENKEPENPERRAAFKKVLRKTAELAPIPALGVAALGTGKLEQINDTKQAIPAALNPDAKAEFLRRLENDTFEAELKMAGGIAVAVPFMGANLLHRILTKAKLKKDAEHDPVAAEMLHRREFIKSTTQTAANLVTYGGILTGTHHLGKLFQANDTPDIIPVNMPNMQYYQMWQNASLAKEKSLKAVENAVIVTAAAAVISHADRIGREREADERGVPGAKK